MKDVSLNDIADRIIDAILECRMINRDELKKIIRPILSIWLQTKIHVPKNSTTLNHQLSHKVSQDLKSFLVKNERLKERIKDKEQEKKFYRNELIKILGDNGIKSIDTKYDLINKN